MHALPLLAVILSTLGPSTPPPGMRPEAWAEAWKEASWAAKEAKRSTPDANEDCMRAVFLHMLASQRIDASGNAGLPHVVAPTKKRDAKAALEKHRDDNCKGGDGGATVSAVLRFATENPEWDTRPMRAQAEYLYRVAQPSMRPGSAVLQGLLGLGLLVPAAGEAAAAPAQVPLPIINPRLFMREPRDGT